jgi:hypothetical protein
MINIRSVSDLRNKFPEYRRNWMRLMRPPQNLSTSNICTASAYSGVYDAVFYVRAWLFCRSRQMIEIKQKYEGKDNE